MAYLRRTGRKNRLYGLEGQLGKQRHKYTGELGYKTRNSGDKYDMERYWANIPILIDKGQARTYGQTASLRRHYAHIVGKTAELRKAGNDLYAKAKKNAAGITNRGVYISHMNKPVREKSAEGVWVDYVVYNDYADWAKVEFGTKYMTGAKVMRNAALGRGPAKIKNKRKASRRSGIERKPRR